MQRSYSSELSSSSFAAIVWKCVATRKGGARVVVVVVEVGRWDEHVKLCESFCNFWSASVYGSSDADLLSWYQGPPCLNFTALDNSSQRNAQI